MKFSQYQGLHQKRLQDFPMRPKDRVLWPSDCWYRVVPWPNCPLPTPSIICTFFASAGRSWVLPVSVNHLPATHLYLPTITGTNFSGHCWIPLLIPCAPYQFWWPFPSYCQHFLLFSVLSRATDAALHFLTESRLPRNSYFSGKPLGSDEWQVQLHPRVASGWSWGHPSRRVPSLSWSPCFPTAFFWTWLPSTGLLQATQPKKIADHPTPE